MSKKNVGSGGVIERAILFFAGCIMAMLGSGAVYFAYKMATDNKIMDYEYVYMALCIGAAFVLLRGAWYTIMPEKEVQRKLWAPNQ